jgi:hypothetical protein
MVRVNNMLIASLCLRVLRVSSVAGMVDVTPPVPTMVRILGAVTASCVVKMVYAVKHVCSFMAARWNIPTIARIVNVRLMRRCVLK